MTVSEQGQRHRADVTQGEIAPAEPMGQHQLESPPAFLLMTEPETIKPPKCEFGEALPSVDDDRLVKSHGSSEEQAHHGVLDVGFGNDKPQELPGMELDAVTMC